MFEITLHQTLRWNERYDRRVGQVNNTCHFTLPVMKSREVHGKTKIKLYRTLMRCVLWYGSKCGHWGRLRETVLNALEGKFLRKIYGPLLVNGQWRNGYDDDICKLYIVMELTGNIRLRGLQRVGHVIRMMYERVLEESLNGYIEGRRAVGRAGGLCLDVMGRDDKGMLRCRSWRRSAESRDGWRRRIEMPGGGGLRCLEVKD
jgi:hypothetical protein